MNEFRNMQYADKLVILFLGYVVQRLFIVDMCSMYALSVTDQGP